MTAKPFPMTESYKTPGVYVQEISKYPPSVAALDTAIPAFIGFTEKEAHGEASVLHVPVRISSLQEFELVFGKAMPQHISVLMDNSGNYNITDVIIDPLRFRLYHSLRLYFDNGGGPCFICTAGSYPAIVNEEEIYTALSQSLAALVNEATITILTFTDAHLAGKEYFYTLQKEALQQCSFLENRMLIADIFSVTHEEKFSDVEKDFREMIGNDHLKYGAAYYPYLKTVYEPYVAEQDEKIVIGENIYKLRLPDSLSADELLSSLYHTHPLLYNSIKNYLSQKKLVLPPSSAIAGIYCRVDSERGVWKAPANVTVQSVIKPMVTISDADQDDMNVHESGKSVNAIRIFTGKGTLVWGARTLTGNDNEWRYVSVRRFISFVNESVKLSMGQFVFEPNDANTWVKVKGMIENFLVFYWRQGALQGSTPVYAFFVNVGLNQTMTSIDILEGRLIIEMGLAVVRPAEFIINRMSFKVMEA